MLTLEREIDQLRGVLGDAKADALISRERREVVSIYPELRICAWGGALLLASAAGLVLRNNLERIGPVALALAMAIAAAACYVTVWMRRSRAGLADDYVLLLGALLLSGDVAFVETQFELLGSDWHRHLLILAFLHGVAAYLFRSRMVLSLSITALAGWLGIERTPFGMFARDPVFFATRAWVCSLLLLGWRAADRRLGAGREPDFAPLFEHFAANLALAAGLALLPQDDFRAIGAVATITIAAGVVAWGFRTKSEWFVLYAFLYGVVAADVLLIEVIGPGVEELVFLVIVVSMIGAIAALFAIHSRFRRLAS